VKAKVALIAVYDGFYNINVLLHWTLVHNETSIHITYIRSYALSFIVYINETTAVGLLFS